MLRALTLCAALSACALLSNTAAGLPFTFTTGAPDGRIGLASRPAAGPTIEIETADDFILTNPTTITGATFTGLLPSSTPLSSINFVGVELYRVFPKDSVNPPSGSVPTRVNSPSDNAFASRDSTAGNLAFTVTLVNPSFSVANSIVNGIHKIPSQTTGGEGAVTGEEVTFTLNFTTPLVLAPDHYFFKPEAGLTAGTLGTFLWLSTARPGPIFAGDLQAWIRNTNLDPDWLRAGTDIVGGNSPPTFNAAFSLTGTAVPEPSTIVLLIGGFAVLAWRRRRGRTVRA
jgi:PEP-CTERM motif